MQLLALIVRTSAFASRQLRLHHNRAIHATRNEGSTSGCLLDTLHMSSLHRAWQLDLEISHFIYSIKRTGPILHIPKGSSCQGLGSR